MDDIAARPSSVSKLGSVAGSSKNLNPPRPPEPSSPHHPDGSAGSPPSSTNADTIAGLRRARSNALRSAACSDSSASASSTTSPLVPGPPAVGVGASIAATYTAAPCSRCDSTAISFPTCATSRCHWMVMSGGFVGRISEQCSRASLHVLPTDSMPRRAAALIGWGPPPPTPAPASPSKL